MAPLRIAFLAVCVFLGGCSAENADRTDPTERELDIVFEGGNVFSGRDEHSKVADVGIAGDRIAAIGDLSDRPAALRIDVSGLAVTPGFIDIHNHAIRTGPDPDRSGIFQWPDAENLIRQGVTTAIGGPDGGSPLPIENSFERLRAQPAAVNYATFVGQGSVRERVIGPDDRPATDAELQRMRDEVANAMRQGAFGLSSGLIYAPGSFASTEEVIELAKVAAGYGGIYISHMRSEGTGVLSAVEETIRIGEAAGLPVQITHHKVMGMPMWGSSAKTLALVDAANGRGLDVTSDQYPYAASSTGLSAMFPRWARDGDKETRHARYDDPVQREKIRDAIVRNMREDRVGDNPQRVAIASCSWDTSMNGLNLSQILEKKDRPVTMENAAELAIEMQQAGGCSAVYHAMDPDDVLRIMQHPATMISSDGGVEAPSERVPHPRNYGAFARVLGRYVREMGALPLYTAIHKMTAMPADRIGLWDRGRLRVGAVADVAVFDPDTVADRATFEDPHQYAIGMHYVLVSGEMVLDAGEMTGRRPGKVIKKTMERTMEKATEENAGPR